MKQSEINNLSLEELKQKLGECRKKYADMKMAHAVAPIEKPLEIKKVRKTIARLMGELTKRELQ